MDPGESSGIELKKFFSSLKEKLFNRNVAVFSFFLLLSFIFWFINALSKDIDSTINYPVRYINFPDNMALVNELPDRMSLDIHGPGYSVLKSKISGNRVPLVINVSNWGRSVREDAAGQEFFIYSFNLRESFKRQLRGDFEINAVRPDTLNFIFGKVISRKVPVKPDIKVMPQRQFMVNGDITADPDSVTLSGPKTVIDTIAFVSTVYHEFNQVNEKLTKKLDIETISKVSISHKNAEITVPVEQFTEQIMEVDIKILNKPDTANVRLFPDAVSIHFNIALSDYNRIQEVPVEAVVDMKNIDIRTVESLKVEIVNLPSFISSVRYNPRRVEYIIEKK
ncbi:MAG: hypothetical protein U5K32_10105 [Bacteroidales bacterium]|nr:hypothetical protein [Bacteroidales bacterium]